MLPKLQHNLTNWIDGMKITRRHFTDSEDALIDHIRDVTALSLHDYDYGLLSPLPGEKLSIDCNVLQGQGGQLKITISYCRAITSGGCRIEILPGIHPELHSDNDISPDADSLRSSGGAYYAVIAVDPFNRQPFGPAVAEEYPPRNQYSINNYKLGLVPEDALNAASVGAFHLAVAKFTVRNGELQKDANYIPPCAVIGAHTGTKQLYNATAEYFNQIQEYALTTVQKVVEGDQNNALAQNVKNLCEQSVKYISSEFFLFRTIYRQQSPVFIADCIVKLANMVSVSLNMLSIKEKEELLQYFNYWNEITPGKFEELLNTVINTDYRHEDIYNSFQPLVSFLKTWCELLDKLKDLKLIGQKNEKFDFGGRTHETPKDKGKDKGKFSIFDF